LFQACSVDSRPRGERVLAGREKAGDRVVVRSLITSALAEGGRDGGAGVECERSVAVGIGGQVCSTSWSSAHAAWA